MLTYSLEFLITLSDPLKDPLVHFALQPANATLPHR